MTGSTNPSGSSTGKNMNLLPLGVLLIVLWFALFGERGVLHLHKLTRQKASLVETLAQVEAHNQSLREQIVLLRGDRSYIEHLARTELGMVRDDELVFQFAGKSGRATAR